MSNPLIITDVDLECIAPNPAGGRSSGEAGVSTETEEEG